MVFVVATAKGKFQGTLQEVCYWQAQMQGSFATVTDLSTGVEVGVDDLDFDPDELAVATREVRKRLQAGG